MDRGDSVSSATWLRFWASQNDKSLGEIAPCRNTIERSRRWAACHESCWKVSNRNENQETSFEKSPTAEVFSKICEWLWSLSTIVYTRFCTACYLINPIVFMMLPCTCTTRISFDREIILFCITEARNLCWFYAIRKMHWFLFTISTSRTRFCVKATIQEALTTFSSVSKVKYPKDN